MKHSHKRARKIAEAVFRGQKTQYKFDVFPLTADIADAPAIYIISRRIMDKFRKGHHSTICLGETASIRTELKKHKRAKCVKQNAANVVCILKDADEANRSLVVDDLQTARSFSCIRNADQPNIKAKPNVKTKKTAPVATNTPKRKKAGDVPVKPAKPASAAKPAAATGKARTAKPVSAPAKKRPAKPNAAPAKKTKKSQPAKAVTPKTTKAKAAKKPVKATVAKAGKLKSTRAVAAKRPAAKRTISAAKPKRSAVPAKRKSPAKKPVAASPKRRKRVQGGVDSKRGQHRLSKPKKSVDQRAKGRTVGRSGTRKKAAA